MGNWAGEQFFTGMRQLHPVEDLLSTQGSVLFIYGMKDRLVDPGALDNFEQRLKSARVPLNIIPIIGATMPFLIPPCSNR